MFSAMQTYLFNSVWRATWRACFDCRLVLDEKVDHWPLGVPDESHWSTAKPDVGVVASLPDVGLASREAARGLTPPLPSKKKNVVVLSRTINKWTQEKFYSAYLCLPSLGGVTGELAERSRPSSKELSNVNLSCDKERRLILKKISK